MTPKEFYLTPSAGVDELEFEKVEQIPLDSLSPGGRWGLPKENLLPFRGPKWLFQYAQQRMSPDGERVEIASLMGSLSVPLLGLNASKPLGLICLYDESQGFKDSTVAHLGRAWGPISEGALMGMQVHPLGGGVVAPIVTSMTTRGMEGTLHEHFVLLPALPSVVRKDGKAALIESDGKLFRIETPEAAIAARKGNAILVVPDARGNFKLPKLA